MIKQFVITGLAFITLFSACQNAEKTTENETKDSAELAEASVVEPVLSFYGDKINSEDAVSSNSLAEMMSDKDSAEIKVSGKINEACKVKGCWMTMDMGNDTEMTVKFKDYSFFVPKDADGFDAVVEGKLTKKVISVEEQKHLAEDAEKSEEEIAAITEPEVRWIFVADGVIIKDYEPTEKAEETEENNEASEDSDKNTGE